MTEELSRIKREYKNAEYWKEKIAEWEATGVSKAAFCKENALSYNSFVFHCAKQKKKPIPAPKNSLIAMKLKMESTESGTTNPLLCSLRLQNGALLTIHDCGVAAVLFERLITNAADI